MNKDNNFLHSIIEGTTDAIFSKDLQGRYVMINSAGARFIGKPVEEIIGTGDMELFSPDTAQKIIELDRDIMATGKTKTFEEVATSNDITRTYLVTKFPYCDQNENIIGLIGIARDITERKQAEEKIKELNESLEQRIAKRTSELAKINEKLRLEIAERKNIEKEIRQAKDYSESLISNSIDMIISVNANRKIVIFNPAAEKTFGYKKEEVLGKQVQILYADSSQSMQVHKTTMNTSGFDGEVLNRKKDGGTFISHLSSTALRDEKGVIIGFMGISRDVTERKQAEEMLRKSEEKYRRLIENLQDNYFFYVHNIEGIFTYVSPSLTNILGHSTEKFLTHYSTYLTDNPINKEVIKHTERSIQGIKQPPYEVEIYHKDGTIRSLQVQEIPIFDNNRKVIAVEGIAQDITERKKAEEMRQEQKKDLEQKNIALSEVLGQIELEKKQIKDNIISNAENLLLPIIQKLRLKGESRKYIQLLRENLQELTSSFGTRLTEKETKLTSREIEICNMVKNGLTSKEIASLLNISFLTIEKHRINIRRKLGIINKDINLTSFLKRL